MSQLNVSLLREIKVGILEDIVNKLVACSNRMVDDYIKDNKCIENNEVVIKGYLHEDYLSNSVITREFGLDNYLFVLENPENFSNGRYKGVVDLKVYLLTLAHKDKKAFFNIECKRLDGGNTLNHEYIKNGICRFTGNNPKYTSRYNESAMLAFLVQDISVEKSIEGINLLLKKEYQQASCTQKEITTSDLTDIYISHHIKNSIEHVVLLHAFIAYSSIISRKSN